ncbi:MAG: translocase FtsK protein [Candidatus Magasanikbacteria bacterium GW2011_GWC2_40_17]|uniref:Translocase FtsK protein n=1 Tax=Candidatus Magasanikbacteria bacterium GW2011_GWA2_42_32 TaxID=1619039 RepID=A0A0G1A5W7_9BACT|nr:MAG: translocase FtsK protein [Candidatus Magasanikbacteria bacterium GW2011_GWC2_40_17]KKS56400.1 MAG: translocase FtsK protein [Candidatus Magasanikbacteria bacterium GW2011_GWA2_42_32]OGH85118.1 MAG: hypothetical protein A2294_03985 [Candidatus Magasanikbacteria bacterium RIFOXYB2_FULL_38_10]
MSKNKRTKEKNRKEKNAPQIKRSLLVIILLIVAGICVLSYFNLGGTAGAYLNRFLGVIFGQLRLTVPLVLILTAFLVEFSGPYNGNTRHFWGFFLFIISLTGLIHLYEPIVLSFLAAKAGQGGGLLGYITSYFLQYAFGFWATLIILIGLLLAAIILLLNTTLAALLQTQKNILLKLGTFGKIIIGVLSLFAKKNTSIPLYNQAENFVEPELSFQAQKIKDFKPTETKTNQETKIEQKKNDNLDEIDEALLDAPLVSKKLAHNLPPINLLTTVKSQPSAGDVKANLFTIQKTFQNFNIPVEMGDVKVGPTVTQYSLKPADGIKLTRITSLNDNLALALAAHPIRIEAPIPGKSLVGVEVPNQKIAIVSLKELLESKDWQLHRGTLKVVVGKDVSGRPWFTDISTLPHLLVAGATGSGKTIYLNALILSLLFSHTSETLRFIFVDPKRVELHLYNGIPHLLTPVITDTQKTVNALRWTIGEMERRFELLSKAGKRNIKEYNAIMEEKMPYIVFVIDELADLMVSAGAEVEGSIVRLAQMARAVGIHLILATQRPSVDIITGLIKANFPARMAFSVASLMDSRTILDTSGAEKLLGRGDMLWSAPDMSKPQRLQGAYISEEEIKKVTDFLKNEDVPQYIDEVVAKQQGILAFGNETSGGDEDEPLLGEAKVVLLQAGKGSASLLQRRLKVGYARAARLLDLLEAQGFIGPADGAKPREILIKNPESTKIEEEKTEETNDDDAVPEELNF